jgi:peptidyl-prolyl cis-trans isomerase D
MFEFIRTHQRLMQIFLAIIIVPSFAFVGIGSYKSFGDDAGTIAKIDGKPLTQQEFDNAVRNQLDSYRQRLGAQFDQKMFDTPEFKQNVLDQLIAQRAIAAEVIHANLNVTDAAAKSHRRHVRRPGSLQHGHLQAGAGCAACAGRQ